MFEAPRGACQFALALSSALLIAPMVQAETSDPIPYNLDSVSALHTGPRGYSVSTELQVNRDSSYRLVVPDKCEESGEIELKRLAQNSLVEESYAFIPSLCLWIETGHNETSKTVRLDTRFINDLVKEHPSIIIYHIHVGRPVEIVEYFPAYSDLVGLVLVNGKFLKNPQVKIEHRAMTSFGLIDYSLVITPELERLLEKLIQTGLTDFVAQNLAYEFARNTHRQNYYSAVRSCTRQSGGTPESLANCFPMRADDFVLNFRTVADYVVTESTE